MGGKPRPATVSDELRALDRDISSMTVGRKRFSPADILIRVQTIIRMFELRHVNDSGFDMELRALADRIERREWLSAIGRCNAIVGMILFRAANDGK